MMQPQGPMAAVGALGRDDVEFVDVLGKTREEECIAKNPCHVAPTLELDNGWSAHLGAQRDYEVPLQLKR